jgi:hypothetical protein
LQGGCIGEGYPPLQVVLSFEEVREYLDTVARLRIRETSSAGRLLTDTGCIWVRPYVAELLGNGPTAIPVGGDRAFGFYGRGWEFPLAAGEEVITFLSLDAAGNYHEFNSHYRRAVRNGRVSPTADSPERVLRTLQGLLVQ